MTLNNACGLFAILFILIPTTLQAKTVYLDEKSSHWKQVGSVPSAKQHFVQFLSTINATKAEGIKNTLLTQGFPAFINIKPWDKKPHYQVHIGPFLSLDTARQAKLKVIQHYPEHRFLSAAILKSKL